MKIIITGGSGFIGNRLVKLLKGIPVYHASKAEGIRADLSDVAQARKIIDEKPDVIINAAGLKDVKKCEQNPELARRINVDIAKNMASIAKECNAFFIQISSDYVFDGTKSNYNELDLPNPKTAYGKTKAEAEEAVVKIMDCCICRTSAVFDSTGSNILTFIQREIKKENPQSFFSNIYNTPTYMGNLADMLKEIIEKKITGIIHLAGKERCSKLEFALTAANVFGWESKKVTGVENTGTWPKDLSLDTSKSEKILNVKPMSIKDGLIAASTCTYC